MNDRQTSTASDPLVRAYLQQLERALSALPPDDRAVIVDEVTEHIVDSLGTGDTPHDPAQVRAVLHALGDPVAIAAEAGAPQPSPATGQRPPFLDRRSGGLVIVLLLLVGGLVVPVLGWLVGVVMLWGSRGWSTLQKYFLADCSGSSFLGALFQPCSGRQRRRSLGAKPRWVLARSNASSWDQSSKRPNGVGWCW